MLCIRRWTQRSRQRAGRGVRRRRSALRADSPAMLALLARRPTRFVRYAHCAQTGAASQSTRRASRAARSAALLGASHARPGRPAASFADTSEVFDRRNQTRWPAEDSGCPSPEVKEEPAAAGRWRGTWRGRAPAGLGAPAGGTPAQRWHVLDTGSSRSPPPPRRSAQRVRAAIKPPAPTHRHRAWPTRCAWRARSAPRPAPAAAARPAGRPPAAAAGTARSAPTRRRTG